MLILNITPENYEYYSCKRMLLRVYPEYKVLICCVVVSTLVFVCEAMLNKLRKRSVVNFVFNFCFYLERGPCVRMNTWCYEYGLLKIQFNSIQFFISSN